MVREKGLRQKAAAVPLFYCMRDEADTPPQVRIAPPPVGNCSDGQKMWTLFLKS